MTRMLGIYDANADGGFIDVNRNHWFFGAAGSAARAGLMTGVTATSFAPNMTIPKEQLVALSARVLQSQMQYTPPANPLQHLVVYADWNILPQWAHADLALATRENLVIPRADGNFAPLDPMTRGDAALQLHRLFVRLW
jgi:hypothetical protein